MGKQKSWNEKGAPPTPTHNPSPLSAILKSSGMRGALWVTHAPRCTIESIQESTIGPIDRNLATPSL